MPPRSRFWRVSQDDSLDELTYSTLDHESRLEDWIESDISILSENLMIIGRQVETDYSGVVDLLCIDREGDLVIVELKRGMTPRDVTAQALDYASWARDLSREDIEEQYARYSNGANLEQDFSDALDQSLPEVLNESHSILIVSSNVDPSTERIIRYLSDEHGVRINAATFDYFVDEQSKDEFLGRIFLIEPEDVERSAQRKGTSKRKPNLTLDQLSEIAEEKGVPQTYRKMAENLSPLFSTHTTRSSLAFAGRYDGHRMTLFSIIPTDSSQEDGLRFQLYLWRLSNFLDTDIEEIERALPDNKESWKYTATSDEDMSGYAGFFTNAEEVDRFVSFIRGRLTD